MWQDDSVAIAFIAFFDRVWYEDSNRYATVEEDLDPALRVQVHIYIEAVVRLSLGFW